MMHLKLPIGLSDFRRLIQDGYYFVDKSLLIKEVLADSPRVLLITRPRRFGKTLNLSMLRYFFVKEVDGQSTAELFDGLNIQQEKEIVRKYQGKYPVIFLTFEDLKCSTYAEAYATVVRLIANLYQEHDYLLDASILRDYEKENYQAFLEKRANKSDIAFSLMKLSEYLYRYYKVSPLILIDECDTPIQSGYLNGYYPQIAELFLHFLGAGLKDNSHCFKAVLTGVLCVLKEASLFSGLNNLITYSVLNKRYGQYFGFTESEVHRLLEQAHLADQSQAIRRWYNGHQIGVHTVYNPWSLLNCVDEQGSLKPYWLNANDHALVKECLYRSGLIHKESFAQLLQGQTIEYLVDEHVVFPDLKNLGPTQQEVILSFLLMAGYFKVVSVEYTLRGSLCRLAIPNIEIAGLYKNLIRHWLTGNREELDFTRLLNELLRGELVQFESGFKNLLERAISVHDLAKEPEAFYHGFMVGLTASLIDHPDYVLKSNRENGYDRYDYLIVSRTPDNPSLLLEFKRLRLESKRSIKQIDLALEQLAKEALTQIESKGYDAEIKPSDDKIIKIAIAFCGKRFKLKY